jgi:hypothetical protein
LPHGKTMSRDPDYKLHQVGGIPKVREDDEKT